MLNPTNPTRDCFSDQLALGSWLLLALCIASYWPALNGGYIWDDIPFVANNPLLQDTEGLFQLWFSHEPVDYWPVTYSSFWLERQIFGLNPFISHVINCLLHGLSAIFIWRILTHLNLHYAWIAAALFVLHPVNVDAVANIFQRKTVLAGLYFFAAFYLWIRFIEKPSRLLYGSSLGLFILAVLSKSTALMLPPVLVIHLVYQRHRLQRQDVFNLLPFFLVSTALGVVALQFQQQGMLQAGYSAGNWLERISNAGHIVMFYLTKIFWPTNLVFVYPRWPVTMQLTDFLNIVVILIIAATGVFYRRSWGTGLLFVAAFYLINLFPVLSFVEIIYFKFSWVADRFQYISMAAVLGVLPHVFHIGLTRVGVTRSDASPFFWTPIVMILMSLCWQQASIFQSEEKVWRHVVDRNPGHWLGHLNLGVHLHRLGQKKEGVAFVEQARLLKPENPLIHFDLGTFASNRGDTVAALKHYRKAILVDQTFAPAHNNLARLLADAGNIDEAEHHYRVALESSLASAQMQSNLGELLFKQRRFIESEKHMLLAIKMNPDLVEALNNLGALLVATSRPEKALYYLDQAIALEPRIAQSHYLRGLAFDSVGLEQQAQQAYRNALHLRPDWSAAKKRLKKINH